MAYSIWNTENRGPGAPGRQPRHSNEHWDFKCKKCGKEATKDVLNPGRKSPCCNAEVEEI